MSKEARSQHHPVTLPHRGKIGAGGMGKVYLADDSRLDRKVALKLSRDGKPSLFSRGEVKKDVVLISNFRQ